MRTISKIQVLVCRMLQRKRQDLKDLVPIDAVPYKQKKKGKT